MRVFVILGVVCIVGISMYLLLSYQPQRTMQNNSQIYQSSISPTMASKSGMLAFSDTSLPISWEEETKATESYQGKAIAGKELRGRLSYKSGYLHSLANREYLQTNGWVENNNLAADGPNGSQWGYTKNKKQVVIFSYTNMSFTPPPTGTTCPCEFTVKIFLGDL
ncbi:MAG TPA: hypothetical protein VLF89_05910 [Candidatus Saccharimonadales bacterium]|nr:hypothetical protein [Candidatus Saccharimonadales bacterium]